MHHMGNIAIIRFDYKVYGKIYGKPNIASDAPIDDMPSTHMPSTHEDMPSTYEASTHEFLYKVAHAS